jgi:hypothetical protein
MFREVLVGGMICVLLMLSGVHIIASVQMYHLDEVGYQLTKTTVIYPRRIPRCNKKLWLRIKDGC